MRPADQEPIEWLNEALVGAVIGLAPILGASLLGLSLLVGVLAGVVALTVLVVLRQWTSRDSKSRRVGK